VCGSLGCATCTCCLPPQNPAPASRLAQVGDLSRLVEAMGQSAFGRRHRKLSAGLAETVEDFGLVRFTTLAIEARLWRARVGLPYPRAHYVLGCSRSPKRTACRLRDTLQKQTSASCKAHA